MKTFLALAVGFIAMLLPAVFIAAMPLHWSFKAMLFYIYIGSVLSTIKSMLK